LTQRHDAGTNRLLSHAVERQGQRGRVAHGQIRVDVEQHQIQAAGLKTDPATRWKVDAVHVPHRHHTVVERALVDLDAVGDVGLDCHQPVVGVPLVDQRHVGGTVRSRRLRNPDVGHADRRRSRRCAAGGKDQPHRACKDHPAPRREIQPHQVVQSAEISRGRSSA
jgi:hypothetical protein